MSVTLVVLLLLWIREQGITLRRSHRLDQLLHTLITSIGIAWDVVVFIYHSPDLFVRSRAASSDGPLVNGAVLLVKTTRITTMKRR